MPQKSSLSTRCVHAGTRPDETSGGVNTPLHVSSAHRYLDHEGLYPRYFNVPNQLAAAEKVAALENAERALIFSSGLAAISTVLFTFLRKGDHLVVQQGIYGGTQHLIEKEFPKQDIAFTFWDAGDPEGLPSLLQDNTKMVYAETPSNPLMNLTDLRKVVGVCREKELLSVLDNTFATPVCQQPLELGIDLSVHSGTKYLGGHSDLCCGAVAGAQSLMEQVHDTGVNLGGSPDARTCHLLERSLKTLDLRLGKQCDNAAALAEFLQAHPKVMKVHYPGLKDHPGHDIAKAQMDSFGAMLSFELGEDAPAPEAFQRKLELITPALSLGGVETTICSPAFTSHAKLTAEQRQAAGISDGLLRLSVGIEGAGDLKEDLEQALGG